MHPFPSFSPKPGEGAGDGESGRSQSRQPPIETSISRHAPLPLIFPKMRGRGRGWGVRKPSIQLTYQRAQQPKEGAVRAKAAQGNGSVGTRPLGLPPHEPTRIPIPPPTPNRSLHPRFLLPGSQTLPRSRRRTPRDPPRTRRRSRLLSRSERNRNDPNAVPRPLQRSSRTHRTLDQRNPSNLRIANRSQN